MAALVNSSGVVVVSKILPFSAFRLKLSADRI